MRRLRRPSHATIVAYLALFIAIGGATAYAADTVFSTDIVDGEVKTADLADSAVTSAKVNDEAIKTDDIGDNAVKSGRIAPNSINGSKVIDGTLSGADILSNSIGLNQIGPDGVSSSELHADSVGPSELQTNAVTGGDIAPGAVDESDVAPSVLGKTYLAYRDQPYTLDGTGQPQPPPFHVVLSLTVPAGSWLLFGKVDIDSPTTYPQTTCRLLGGSALDEGRTGGWETGAAARYGSTMTLTTAWTFIKATTVYLTCQPPGGYKTVASWRKIAAIRTGTLSLQAKSGP